MALTLRTAITAGQTTFDVLGSDDLQPGDFKTIGSETIVIRTANQATLDYGDAARRRVSAYRGAGGTRSAAHDAAATLSTYSGGGGGSLNVDNTVDPPEEVTTIIAPGAVVGGGEADLAGLVTLYQRTTTLTDAQIKALPSGGVEAIPAPGAGVMLVPVAAILHANLAGSYTNIDLNAYLAIEVGGAETIILASETAVEEAFVSSFLGVVDNVVGLALSRSEYLGVAGSVFGALGAIAQSAFANQAATFFAVNGAAGNFTGGNAANVVKITVWYAVVDVS